MTRRETLMLAQMYDPSRHPIAGSYMSEKLDGLRAWWDGGVSRGRPAADVAWANIKKSGRDAVCTGLWSRYFKVIHAPSWWLDGLPEGVCLDGELYCSSGVQRTNSIVRTTCGLDKGWDEITYCIFDSPSLGEVLTPGEIKGVNCELTLFGGTAARREPFSKRWERVCELVSPSARPWDQVKLSMDHNVAVRELDAGLEKVLSSGGEGVMLRRPSSFWVPKRTADLVKVKPYDEDVGEIVAVNGGTGRLAGIMGSLVVLWRAKCFALGTGFTDEEREGDWPIGSKVKFKYRTLSDAGVPKEARFCGRG